MPETRAGLARECFQRADSYFFVYPAGREKISSAIGSVDRAVIIVVMPRSADAGDTEQANSTRIATTALLMALFFMMSAAALADDGSESTAAA
jgi:hypothetical protein